MQEVVEVVEEAAPAETTEQPAAEEEAASAQEPVVAGFIPTGAEAVMEGVTVRFALRSMWKVGDIMILEYFSQLYSQKSFINCRFKARRSADTL